jgi:sulfite exporter TauE/SafE/copper chaperone CopZ
MASITKDIRIDGMHCKNCEKRVVDALTAVDGVDRVSVGWKTGRGSVTFDDRKVQQRELVGKLDTIGYRLTFGDGGEKPAGSEVGRKFPKAAGSEAGRKFPKAAGAIFAALGLVMIVYLILKVSSAVTVPDITPTMGLGLLFVVGLLTGFHCVGMCGGFVVGYSARAAEEKRPALPSHLQYGAGKLLSYTVIGAGFGLVGSIITFTPLMRGVAGMVAGVFLILYGLSMLDLPWAKGFRIPAPAFLSRFVSKQSHHYRSPLAFGLLNGLMIACGPLQAIYVMAAGSASALEGAKYLFVFGLGTLPVMLGFGFATSLISARSTRRVLVASGVVVMALGVIMINRGLALSGAGLDASSLMTSGIASKEAGAPVGIEMKDGYQIIRMDVTRYGWEPDRFVLAKGVPVKWIITGVEINSCNNAIVVPEYGLNFPVREGEQVIEFTPNENGVISWSCWMGMIPGAFVVKDAKDIAEGGATDSELESLPVPRGGTCRMGGGIGGGCCGGGIRQ